MREESDPKTTPIDSVLQALQRTLKITRPLTVLDVETTGTDTKRDRVVEVAFSTVTQSGEVTNRKRLINPEEPIPAEATAIHDISDRDVVGEPTFRQIGRSLAEQLTGQDFVAYNHQFDREILTAEFERAGVPSPFKGPWICPMQLWNEPSIHKLPVAFKRFTDSPPDKSKTHEASYDVFMTAAVLAAQLRSPAETDPLPLSVIELARLSNEQHRSWLDARGILMWHNGLPTFRMGKHAGKTLQEAAQTNRGFLRWALIDSDYEQDLKTIIGNALDGEFPTRAPSR